MGTDNAKRLSSASRNSKTVAEDSDKTVRCPHFPFIPVNILPLRSISTREEHSFLVIMTVRTASPSEGSPRMDPEHNVRRRNSPRLKLLNKTQRKACKVIGNMMGSFRNNSPRNTNATTKETESMCVTIIDSVPVSPSWRDSVLPLTPGMTIESTIELMSSSSFDDNRKGLQLLNMMTKLNNFSSTPKSTASYQIVYGDSDWVVKRVRTLLLSFLSGKIVVDTLTSVEDDLSMVSALSDDNSVASDASDMENFRDTASNGRHGGALHCTALRVVVTSLEHICYSSCFCDELEKRSIDFRSDFWKSLTEILTRNIETGTVADYTGYSLRCLRLLVEVETTAIIPLIRYTMLPFIMNLKDIGDQQNYPMIQDEVSKLLSRLL